MVAHFFLPSDLFPVAKNFARAVSNRSECGEACVCVCLYEAYGKRRIIYMRSGSLQFIKQIELIANNMRIMLNETFFFSISFPLTQTVTSSTLYVCEIQQTIYFIFIAVFR